MPTRGLLFLFSVAIATGTLVVAGWLLTTRQAASFDGLFLFLSSLLVALAFSLYARFLIREVMRELVAKKPKTLPASRTQSISQVYEKTAR